MKLLVTVIIPVYNSSQLIERCIQSILSQTLKNIEIICVLDCPTDGTDDIVKEIAANNSNILVIENTQNLGVAGCRNKGVELARGEYIGFSDHDDWCEPQMYETLFQKAKAENLDVVISDSFIDKKGQSKVYTYQDPSLKGIIGSVYLPMFSIKPKNHLAKSVWASLYRQEFVMNSGALFVDRKKYWEEDSLFNMTVFCQKPQWGYINKPFYHWNLDRPVLKANYSNTANPEMVIHSFRELSLLMQKSGMFDNREIERLKKRFLSVAFSFYYYHYRNIPANQLKALLGEDARYLSLPYAELSLFTGKQKKTFTGNIIKAYKFARFLRKIKTA